MPLFLYIALFLYCSLSLCYGYCYRYCYHYRYRYRYRSNYCYCYRYRYRYNSVYVYQVDNTYIPELGKQLIVVGFSSAFVWKNEGRFICVESAKEGSVMDGRANGWVKANCLWWVLMSETFEMELIWDMLYQIWGILKHLEVVGKKSTSFSCRRK